MALPERKIGKEGFVGSTEGYGAMSLTNFGQPDHAEGAEDTLRHVLQSGVTVINTAVFYGQGENEKIIGKALIPSLSCSCDPTTEQLAPDMLHLYKAVNTTFLPNKAITCRSYKQLQESAVMWRSCGALQAG